MVVGHRPAHDHPRVQVLDDGQVQPALPRRDVGDVRHPRLVRPPSGSNCRSRRLSATGRSWLESVVQRNFRAVLAAMPCSRISLATVLTQQPWPRAVQLGVDARAAVAGLDLGVDGLDLDDQRSAVSASAGLSAAQPQA